MGIFLKFWPNYGYQESPKALHFSNFIFKYRFLAKYIISSPPIKGLIPRVCWFQPEATNKSIDKSSSMDEVLPLPSLLFRQKKDRDIERREKRERRGSGWDTQRRRRKRSRRRARRNGRRVLFSRTLRQLGCGWSVSGGMQLREQGGEGVGTVAVRKVRSQEKRRRKDDRSLESHGERG
jgi:hypothetical protein